VRTDRQTDTLEDRAKTISCSAASLANMASNEVDEVRGVCYM